MSVRNAFYLAQYTPNPFLAGDPAGEVYDAPPDTLVRWGAMPLLIPLP